jgi:hypothetical protein
MSLKPVDMVCIECDGLGSVGDPVFSLENNNPSDETRKVLVHFGGKNLFFLFNEGQQIIGLTVEIDKEFL